MKNERGKIIDLCASIFILAGLAVGVYMFTKSVATGIAVIVISFLVFFAVIGIAELLHLLQKIEVRLSNLEHELEQQRHNKIQNIDK